MADAFLVAIDKSTIGVHAQWPPPVSQLADNATWETKVTAIGPNRLEPQQPAWNLVLHIKTTAQEAADATYKSITIDYSDGTKPYRATNETGLTIKQSC